MSLIQRSRSNATHTRRLHAYRPRVDLLEMRTQPGSFFATAAAVSPEALTLNMDSELSRPDPSHRPALVSVISKVGESRAVQVSGEASRVGAPQGQSPHSPDVQSFKIDSADALRLTMLSTPGLDVLTPQRHSAGPSKHESQMATTNGLNDAASLVAPGSMLQGVRSTCGLGATNQWQPVGPQPYTAKFADPPTAQSYTGRTIAVVADPTNPDRIVLGTWGGGVWKTTNGGQNWTPLTDSLPSASINSLALAGSQIIYAGTSETYPGSGIGLLRSLDDGASWQVLGSTQFSRRVVSAIVPHPSDPANTVYVAIGETGTLTQGLVSNRGVWKTTDGGTTWTNTTASVIPATESVTALVMDPTNPLRLYAAVGEAKGTATDLTPNGVYRTDDGGSTWTKLAGFPSTKFFAVIRLGLSPDAPNTLYAYVSAPPNATNTSAFAIHKSTDAGNTWAQLPTPAGLGGNALNTGFAIDPNDADRVFVGRAKFDYSVMMSSDGGQTWQDIHYGQTYSPHVDHRGGFVDANGRYLDADDGGLARYDATAQDWENLNGDLHVVQLSTIDSHPTQSGILLGGGADNGILMTRGSLSWRASRTGDGFSVAYDPVEPTTAYSTLQGYTFARSDDGGRHWTLKLNGIQVGLPSNMVFEIDPDPARHDHLVAGTRALYESHDRGDSWQEIRNFTSSVEAIGLSQDENTMYVAAAGFVHATHDGGQTWTQFAIAPPVNDRVRAIVVSPSDPNVAYFVRAGLDKANVLKTTNGGANWTSIESNLPNTSVTDILIHDHTGGTALIVATDVGVYVSENDGGSWAPLGLDLPKASARELSVFENGGPCELYVAFNGRGAWSLDLT